MPLVRVAQMLVGLNPRNTEAAREVAAGEKKKNSASTATDATDMIAGRENRRAVGPPDGADGRDTYTGEDIVERGRVEVVDGMDKVGGDERGLDAGAREGSENRRGPGYM